MKAPKEYTPEELDGGSEMLAASREHDGLVFDWEIQELGAPHLITFLVEVRCQGDTSRIRFTIDLAKLSSAQLEGVHAILALRHAALDDRRAAAQYRMDDNNFTGAGFIQKGHERGRAGSGKTATELTTPRLLLLFPRRGASL